jgi:hypothetical protein
VQTECCYAVQELEARVRNRTQSLADAMVIYAASANRLPYNAACEVYVVIIRVANNATKTLMKKVVYESRLYFACANGHKVCHIAHLPNLEG